MLYNLLVTFAYGNSEWQYFFALPLITKKEIHEYVGTLHIREFLFGDSKNQTFYRDELS